MEDSSMITTDADETLMECSVSDVDQSVEERPKETVAESVKKRKRSGPSQQQSGPTPKKRGRSIAATPRKDPGTQLYDIVLEGKSAFQSVVRNWVEEYGNDSETAMVNLIQFFVHSSGCKANITLKMYRTEDASKVIGSLTENFSEESGEYPLMMSGPLYKKFKSNLSEFVECLIDQCHNSIIYDEYMLDTLVLWLVGFTDSQVRAFRHTCTLACMKLTTALVHVAAGVTTEQDNTQRQAESERKRNPSQSSAKLQRLEKKLAELEQQLTDLHQMLGTLFSSVFIHRYRDVCSEIRSLCIAELGQWMEQYSVHYLNDSYLKYIGWTLYDKSPDVRLHSILALLPLLSSPEFFPHLDLFIQKFKERLVSMKLDKDENVAVNAISLCCHLLDVDVLEEEECVELCELIFFDTRSIAQAAGAFAAKYLFLDEFVKKAQQGKPAKGKKKPTVSQIKLKEIVHFFVDAKLHQHAVYLVDSMWDHASVLKEWSTMITMLLDSSCGIALSAEEEKGLIEILTCTIKRAVGITVLPSKGRGKGATSVREKRTIEADKESIGSAFIPVLPELISKFGTEPDNALNLVCICQHFDLELFVELRAQKHLELLLAQLKDMALKHTSVEVLDEVALTFNHLLDPDFTLHSTVDVCFGQLASELLEDFKNCLSVVQGNSGMDDESSDVYNLSVVMKRITSFYKSVDLSSWEFSEQFLTIVDAAVDGDANSSDMLTTPAITCLKMHLLWQLQALDEESATREELRRVHSLTEKIMTQDHQLLKFGGGSVQREAYCALCDLLIAFSPHLQDHGLLASIAYTANDRLQRTMCDYVMENVLEEEEEEEEPESEEEVFSQAEALNNKRLLLAGFLKLIIYSVFETTVAAPVFGQYIKHFQSFGDLIKTAITRSRELNPYMWSKTILLSLQDLYKAILEDRGVVDHDNPEWVSIKELARRYALTMGFDQLKHRQSLVGIHRDGIKFALSREEEEEEEDAPPPNLVFLDVLTEFSYRLLDIDRKGQKGLLLYLKQQLGEGVLERVELLDDWKPLHRYVVSLVREDPATDSGKKKTSRAAKRKLPEGASKETGGRGTKSPFGVDE